MKAQVWSAALAAVCIGGCGGGSSSETLPRSERGDESVVRECNHDGRVESLDVNKDSKADIHHIYDGNQEVCVQYDLNFDGRIDSTRFFEKDGKTVQQEHQDFDFDGRVDQITFYSNGKVAKKELDTNFDYIIDTWIWCEGQNVRRSERDRKHKGHPDTWEEYTQGVLSEIRYDDNNDGKAERWETFKAGRVVEVSEDTNGDGKADRKEPIPPENAGPLVEPLQCGVDEKPQAQNQAKNPAKN